MQATIVPPRTDELVGPLLASLPAASISPSPPEALLPLLSPILRQRVQLLSASADEPWLPLLCYDSSKASALSTVAHSERLEPHPVSGEVEVDWEYDVELQYKRIDSETLQSLVSLADLQLSVRLVWCVNDEVGGGDGWRIGEVSVWDTADLTWGKYTIQEAEAAFRSNSRDAPLSSYNRINGTNSLLTPEAENEEDDDDDYWAQYDNTPARTPAPKHSPAPQSLRTGQQANGDEDSYYAQYASVQPAMDNHDPDEAQANGEVETSLGRDEITNHLHHHQRFESISQSEVQNSSLAWSDGQDEVDVPMMYNDHTPDENGIAHPRPGSSTGSSGSDTVARLEKRAARESETREQSEVGIKRHIGSSVKSLYRLARTAGIDREEFERIIRTELDCLALMDEEEV